jgi:hypothetical protein
MFMKGQRPVRLTSDLTDFFTAIFSEDLSQCALYADRRELIEAAFPVEDRCPPQVRLTSRTETDFADNAIAAG